MRDECLNEILFISSVRAGRLAARLKHVQAALEIGQENIRGDGRPKCPGRAPGQTGIDPTPIVKEPRFTSDWYQSRQHIKGCNSSKLCCSHPFSIIEFIDRFVRPRAMSGQSRSTVARPAGQPSRSSLLPSSSFPPANWMTASAASTSAG